MTQHLPEHARNFKGKAQNIPESDVFFLPYQDKWIADRAIMKIMEKSRRIGISYGTSYELVREHSRKESNLDTWYSSRDEATARLNIADCTTFARALDRGAEDLGEQVIDANEHHSAFSLRFSNATNIHSVASNPDVFAGKGGNVVLDEMGLRRDPRAVFAIAAPSTDWGGSMKIISTHRGTHNYFNELIQGIMHKGNPKNFSHHRVTLQDALDQNFLWKIQTKLREEDPRMQMDEAEYFDYIRNRAPDTETFLQEYMCQPSDDNAAFLSYDLITACEYELAEPWEIPLHDILNPLYVGVDVGREHDLTVIWVYEKVGGVFFTRKVITMQGETFDAQEHELYQILALPGVRRCCIDNTGLGRQFAERAQKRFGPYKVEPVNFTGPVKEELAYPMRAAFEDHTIRIPQSEKIRADLRAIKKETTAAGNIRFTADRGKNGHSDRFWAAALGIHAGKRSGTIGAIHPARASKFTRAMQARRDRSFSI